MPRNLWIAYIITWVIHLVYILTLRGGFARLRQQIGQVTKRDR